MNNYIMAGISFLAGAAVSGVTAWFVAKKRYEKRHQQEMDTVWKDLQKDKGEAEINKKYEDFNIKLEPGEGLVADIIHKPDLASYANIIRESGYTDTTDLPKTNDYIYEIDNNQFDEDEYKIIDLTLYADGILADDEDYPIRDIKECVGEHYLEMMQGKDEIIIRNEKHKTDYDICRSMLSFGEMLQNHPETEQRIQFDDALENYYNGEEEIEPDEEEDEE